VWRVGTGDRSAPALRWSSWPARVLAHGQAPSSSLSGATCQAARPLSGEDFLYVLYPAGASRPRARPSTLVPIARDHAASARLIATFYPAGRVASAQAGLALDQLSVFTIGQLAATPSGRSKVHLAPSAHQQRGRPWQSPRRESLRSLATTELTCPLRSHRCGRRSTPRCTWTQRTTACRRSPRHTCFRADCARRTRA
jgi:hypothetical protein